MKNNLSMISLLIVIFTITALPSCKKNTHDGLKPYKYTRYTAEYKSRSQVIAAINGDAAQPIEKAGKIYINGNYIFLNDVDKGIHVYDNSNPAHPAQVAFLAIPGNLDIAVKGNVLYADMYAELLAVDISNIKKVNVVNSLPNFFYGRTYVNGQQTMMNDQIAASWKTMDTTLWVPESQTGGYCLYCPMMNFDNALANASVKGTAGSMAGMVMMNDHLYAISEMHSLSIVDITNATSPKLDSSFFAGFDLQTIFPFDNKLFLGSAIGMFMYDVRDPKHPVSLGEFSHGRACDPVVTDGSYAYVTLHAGDGCGSTSNQLDVIDVRKLPESKLVKTYQLSKPTGLCKDGNLLFVCDDTKLKIFDATKPENLRSIKEINSKEPYDVIAFNKRAMVVCKDGVYQYNYSNVNNVKLLSFIPVKR